MKLLFDENLSPRLVVLLHDLFPDSVHVRNIGLQAADDLQVWDHAKNNGLIIVSKDAGMHQRSFMFGAPPKVVWVRLGLLNLRSRRIAATTHRGDQSIS
jgi:predicted nuclease of predicted toxin-antitoxin system